MNVAPLFAESQPGPAKEEDITPSFVEMARVIASVCATRMLLMICVVTGSAIWAYVCFDPTRDRLYAAIAFSLVFVIPQTLLYFRKG